MKAVCANGPLTKGIDIYQGDLITDITKVVAWGIQYAMLKVFENQLDPKFNSRWQSMLNHGIRRGGYDFFHPERDAKTQAQTTCSLMIKANQGKPFQKTDSIWLDWERSGGVASPNDREAGYAWLIEAEKEIGITPGIYGSPAFLAALALDSRFKRFPLWVANYGVKCPLVPAPWDNWQFWQTSGSGIVPGMNGHCDTDVFNGTIDQLDAFLTKLAVSAG